MNFVIFRCFRCFSLLFVIIRYLSLLSIVIICVIVYYSFILIVLTMENVKSVRANNYITGSTDGYGKSLGFRWLPPNHTQSSPNNAQLENIETPDQRLFKFIKPISFALIKDSCYASAFNSWVTVYSLSTYSEQYKTISKGNVPVISCSISARYTTQNGILRVHGKANELTQKRARENAFKNVLQNYINAMPVIQMETEQGDAIQDSDRASNTIVTRDAAQSISEEQRVNPITLPIICSTEPLHEFASVMNRWMTLDGLEVKATHKTEEAIASYDLPSFLYKSNKAPNMMPFENFIYGMYNIEFKFVVNANKFHVGKVLCSVKYDSYQMDERRNGVVASLCRPHVILDLATNNEGILAVPFKYHRTFVRNAKIDHTQFGVKRAHYATVQVQVLSPLGAIAGAAQSMFIRPFFRIKQAQLTGMSYRVPLVQGDGLNLESLLSVVGSIANLDRPTDLQRQQQVIPKSRLHFCAGKGPIDSVPMRMDPGTMTTYLEDHKFPEDPKDMMEIARIWGLAWQFDWKSSDAEGAEITVQNIDPTYHCPISYVGTPTPLEYVASMYQFWSGTIEIRLDFVSNAFHTGSVMLSAEFGRTSSDLTQSSSTYTKTFHLGDQKSCTFTIPYIYDTPYRRTSCVPWTPLGTVSTSEATALNSAMGQNALLPTVAARFKVRVINKLVPIQSTTQNIQVLVFMRAGSDFTCHSPIMANLESNEVAGIMNSFPGAYAETQMDTGEKEDVDPTQDFNAGVPRNNIMSVDNHTNIKDLLRRPVQIIYQWKCSSLESQQEMNVYYLPCMPPSRMCGPAQASNAKDEYKKNGVYSDGLLRSYHTHVLDLFRFWRGSQRFTFLFHTKEPVFISYVPHSGARVVGSPTCNEVNLLRSKSYTVNPSSMGLPTEIVIPSINPSVVIETPYELENNFALMQEQFSSDNYSWRDKGDTNAGHIILWAPKSFTCDVWWSAGDDFEVSNFLGIPPCRSFISQFYKMDDLPKSQMDDGEQFYDTEDFQNVESSDNNSNLSYVDKFKKFVRPYTFSLGTAAVSQIPIIGNAAAMASVSHNLTTQASAITDKAVNTMDNINSLVTQTQSLATQLTSTSQDTSELIQNTNSAIKELARLLSMKNIQDTASDIINTITTKVASLVEVGTHLYTVVVNVVIDILLNLVDFNYRTLALSIVRFIANVTGIALLKLTQFIEPVVTFFRSHFAVTTQGDTATEHLSAGFWTEDVIKQGLGLFVGIIGTAVGISVDKRPVDSWSASILKRLCSSGGMSFINGSMRFVETIFIMIKEAIFSLLGHFSYENKALMCLRAKSKVVDNFMKEAQLMMNEANLAQIHNPEFKIRFWTNVVNAYEIQKQLANLPSNRISPILARTCGEVIKLGKEKMADLRSSPIRYEPFVICVEGPSKIGKSFATTPMATELLQAIGYKCSSNNPIYYRIQGSKFWNDYTDQPCVVIDEWMNLSDPQSVLDGVRELFQLKSPAVFIPEQAAIEEKKIRANPKLVIILTNTPFPDVLLNNTVTHPEAVYRRRDVLLNANLTPEARGINLHSMPKEDKMALKHLRFRFYEDSTMKDSLCEDGYDYTSVMEELKRRFVQYDKEESENVKIRMAQLQKFWQVKTLNLTDPFSLFYEGVLHAASTSNSQVLPSEILELEVSRLATMMDSMEETSEVTPAQVSTEGMLGVSTLATIGLMTARTLCRYLRTWTAPIPQTHTACCVCNEAAESFVACTQSYEQFVTNSNPEVLHIICRSCCISNRALGTGGCPLCRYPSFVPIIPKEHVGALKAMWRLKKLGIKVQPYLDALTPMTVSTLLFALDCVFLVAPGFQAGTIVNPSGAFDSPILSMWEGKDNIIVTGVKLGLHFGFEYICNKIWKTSQRQEKIDDITQMIKQHIEIAQPIAPVSETKLRVYKEKWLCPREWVNTRSTHTDLHQAIRQFDYMHPLFEDEYQPSAEWDPYGIYAYHPNFPETQMEPTESLIHRRVMFRPAHAEIDDNNYRFNATKFTQDWDQLEMSERITGDATHQTCLHADMVDYMPTATWEDGAFSIPTSCGYRRLEWKKCKEFCLLETMDRKAICESYFDFKKTTMYTYISNHYHTEEFKNTYANKIPSFAIPYWLDTTSFTIHEDYDSWLSKLTIPPLLMTLLKAIGISVTVFATFKGLQSLSNVLFNSNPVSQIISSGDAVIRKFKPETRKLQHNIVKAQGSCEEAITSKVVNNYFVIRVKNTVDNSTRQLVGIGIKQRIGILPRHYYEYMRDLDHSNHVITIGPATVVDHGIAYSYSDSDFLQSDVSDLAVFYLPTSYNMFKDIIKYFGTDSDLNSKHSSIAQMVRVPTRTENYISIIQLELKGYKKRQTIVGSNGAFTSLDNLEYNYSQSGACGSAVIINNHTRPIRGIHIAGHGKLYGGTGYAALITQEDLEMIPLANNTVHVQGLEEPDFLTEDITLYLPEESRVSYKGAVSKQLTPYASDKSAIRPSVIADVIPWKTTKGPAILSKKDSRYTHPISPLIAGCAKHGYLTKDFPSDQLDEIASIRAEELLAHRPLVLNPERLTIKEAIIGLPDIPHYEPIKMNTSAGWPYCASTKTTKDQWTTIIRNEQEMPIDCEVDDQVLQEVARKENLRKQGIVPMTLFVDTLKDEKKSLEKIPKLGSTRVFCSSPYDFTISMRQNFLHFVAMYYENRDKLKHSVGISMTGPEVTQLVTDLLSVGNNIVTLDYSNFGPGFNASVAGTFKKTIVKWVSEYVANVNEAELESLVEENINSHHLMMNTVYQQRGGSPSGSPLTVVINSEENISYIMLAWLNIAKPKKDTNRWDEFNKHVVLRVYGDDLIMSVSDDYIEQFNGETIMNFFKKYGIVATDATKSASIIRSTGIDKASYLKHTFHPHPTRKGEWLAALDIESVRDTPLWIQEPIQFKEATRVNAEAAIRNAYGHGPQAFNQFKSVINKALRDKNLAPILLTWKELDDNFFNQ